MAEEAGVSTATVSHVLNKTRYVSPAVEKRVRDAMALLEYRPNSVARSLRLKSTRTLGVILSTNMNAYFAEIVQGIEEACAEHGFQELISYSNGNRDIEKKSIEEMLERGVDGFILNSVLDDSDLAKRVTKIGKPVVLINRYLENVSADFYHTDDFSGAYKGTDYLIKLGHSKIACITKHSPNSYSYSSRIDGYRKALKDHEIMPDDSLVINKDFTPKDGFEALPVLLASKNKPTAVFCFGDSIALGVLAAAYRMGIKVPEDLSVLGYDNIEMSEYSVPGLCTIHQEKRELGKKAVHTLLDRIKKPESGNFRHILESKLIIRSSCAPVKK